MTSHPPLLLSWSLPDFYHSCHPPSPLFLPPFSSFLPPPHSSPPSPLFNASCVLRRCQLHLHIFVSKMSGCCAEVPPSESFLVKMKSTSSEGFDIRQNP
ncbi:hypothetical protein CDAR_609541 [Caerostris darwini]|uniref:Uncharacterized protein n=1 Tax=Caerostris darwini TaxID=1538125 RepID=A0AAV4SEV6_9ARAC|nr:hypothetical protein CDAR_609541 [Caerostris darwini]